MTGSPQLWQPGSTSLVRQTLGNVSMHEWSALVRRMVRSRLAVSLPSESCPPELSGGAFSAEKDRDRDRFMCDSLFAVSFCPSVLVCAVLCWRDSDLAPERDLEDWWTPDLVSGNADVHVSPPDNSRQVSITGIMMGDANAVAVLEMAHRGQLINAGALHVNSLFLPERPLPRGLEFGTSTMTTSSSLHSYTSQNWNSSGIASELQERA